MSWFRKEKRGLKSQPKKVIPDNLWIKCDSCGEILYKKELEKNLMVCPRCQFHYGLSPEENIPIILDPGSFNEYEHDLQSVDPHKFVDRMKYTDRLQKALKNTGKNEAVVVRHYSPENYATRLMHLYTHVVNNDVIQSIDKAVLLESFLDPHHFSLLKWGGIQ